MAIFKPNKYWEGETLVGESFITQLIQDTAPRSLKGAYVVGDIIKLMGKRSYIKKPESMDIFLHYKGKPIQKEYQKNLEHTIEALAVNDLPVNVLAKNYHPFKSKENGGRNIPSVYILYINI
ncbi:MAG: hypothetical protein ACOCZQ_01535 [Nanoarchaeota archaeon]